MVTNFTQLSYCQNDMTAFRLALSYWSIFRVIWDLSTNPKIPNRLVQAITSLEFINLSNISCLFAGLLSHLLWGRFLLFGKWELPNQGMCAHICGNSIDLALTVWEPTNQYMWVFVYARAKRYRCDIHWVKGRGHPCSRYVKKPSFLSHESHIVEGCGHSCTQELRSIDTRATQSRDISAHVCGKSRDLAFTLWKPLDQGMWATVFARARRHRHESNLVKGCWHLCSQ